MSCLSTALVDGRLHLFCTFAKHTWERFLLAKFLAHDMLGPRFWASHGQRRSFVSSLRTIAPFHIERKRDCCLSRGTTKRRMPEDCGSHAEFMASLAELRHLQP